MRNTKLRCAALIISLVISQAVQAYDQDRNVAGKLTTLKKPQVLVMTENQQKVASANTVVLNLDVDPDEIVCRKERVGRYAASKLKVQRCRTRADIREQAEREMARNGRDADDLKRRMSTMQSAAQIRDTRIENKYRYLGL